MKGTVCQPKGNDAAKVVSLTGFHLSPAYYGGRPVFVIGGVRYYMASKHRTARAARKGADGAPVIGKYLIWYLRLYRIPANKATRRTVGGGPVSSG